MLIPIFNSSSCFQGHVWCFILPQLFMCCKCPKLLLMVINTKWFTIHITVKKASSTSIFSSQSVNCLFISMLYLILSHPPALVCLLVCTMCLLWPWTPYSMHAHTHIDTDTHCPPAPPYRHPFALDPCAGALWSALLWITSGQAARNCHLPLQHYPSCQSCFIIVTFSYSPVEQREVSNIVRHTNTQTHSKHTHAEYTFLYW